MVVFDVGNLKLLCQKKIVHCLRAVHVGPGEKHLVIDESLMRPLDRMCGASFLKSNGVSKIFKLEDYFNTIISVDDETHVVVFVRSDINIFHKIKNFCDKINLRCQMGTNLHLLVTPKLTEACRNLLELEGLHDLLSYIELPLDFLPLDVDLVSMEMPSMFAELALDNDYSSIPSLSGAISAIQGLFGLPHSVFALGPHSKVLSDHLKSHQNEQSYAHEDDDSDIDILLLMDRSQDLVSPLLSPLTFQGALDDHFGINCCYMEMPPDAKSTTTAASGDTTATTPTVLILGPEIEVFAQAKDLHFAQVSEFVRAKLQELEDIKKSKANLRGINELKEFVANDLRKFQTESNVLTNLLSAVDRVIGAGKNTRVRQLQLEQSVVANCSYDREDIAYIDDLICQQLPMTHALRNISLICIACGGLSSSDLKFFKTHFLHSYGYEHMLSWVNLEKAGLIFATSDASRQLPLFSTWAKKLGCLDLNRAAKINAASKFDSPYYATNGVFCPLICKILEFMFCGKVEDIRKVFGTAFHERNLPSQSHRSAKKLKSIVICLIGGLTYLECAILRLFAAKLEIRLLLTTSGMINSKKLFNPLLECF